MTHSRRMKELAGAWGIFCVFGVFAFFVSISVWVAIENPDATGADPPWWALVWLAPFFGSFAAALLAATAFLGYLAVSTVAFAIRPPAIARIPKRDLRANQ